MATRTVEHLDYCEYIRAPLRLLCIHSGATTRELIDARLQERLSPAMTVWKLASALLWKGSSTEMFFHQENKKTKNNRSRLEATDRLAITEKRNSLYYSHMLFTHSFAEPTKTQTLHPLKPHVEHHKLSTKRSTTLANPMVSPKNLCATGLGGHVLFPSSTQFFGIIQKLASRTSSHDSHRSAVGLHWRRFRTLSF
jgi:hypothetical protein